MTPRKKQVSRRKFVRKAALGGAALAAGGAAWSLLRKAPGPRYPEAWLGDARLSGGQGPTPDNSAASRAGAAEAPAAAAARPNIVLIIADDLGWGDLSCYGSRAIATPNLDRLAAEGVRCTDFHSCDAVCTPSRAGLLTGRYPARMMLDTPLHPGREPLGRRAMVRLGYLFGKAGLLDLATRRAAEGLHPAEITLAEALRAGGYRTGMVGKWHLGDFGVHPELHPLRQGFDSYLGVPYSNDMSPLPLYRNQGMLEADVRDQATLTGLYTQEAVDFLTWPSDQPFFLYLAHTFPHRPLHASPRFQGSSAGGLYGDVVQELDWSVGQVLEALDSAGLAGNTLVLFTSDNGPWYEGSPGPFRGRKGQSFEGGHRVPFLARAPGRIPPGTLCETPAINLDLFPTCLAAAGRSLPADRTIDGRDITPLLTGAAGEPHHRHLYLYHQGDLEGIRAGEWKYFRSTSHYTWPMPVNKKLGGLANHTTGPLPLLHNLTLDPGEAYNLADRHPEVVAELEAALAAWEAEMKANPLGVVG
jgi:uncharacterized sulfatase